MSIFVQLGPTPDTTWQARNALGRELLERAAQVAANEAARHKILVGGAMQHLDLYDIDSPLREQVWQAVEETARTASTETPGPSPLWPQEWIDRVADLARGMEARRLDPELPAHGPSHTPGLGQCSGMTLKGAYDLGCGSCLRE